MAVTFSTALQGCRCPKVADVSSIWQVDMSCFSVGIWGYKPDLWQNQHSVKFTKFADFVFFFPSTFSWINPKASIPMRKANGNVINHLRWLKDLILANCSNVAFTTWMSMYKENIVATLLPRILLKIRLVKWSVFKFFPAWNNWKINVLLVYSNYSKLFPDNIFCTSMNFSAISPNKNYSGMLYSYPPHTWI